MNTSSKWMRVRSRRLRLLALPTLAAIGLGAFAALGSAAPERAQQAPRNTQPPTITGTPRQGQTLTGHPGTWTGTTPMTFTFRWLRCNANGNNCSAISGATNATYRVVSADRNRTLRFHVTARNASGTGTARSAAVLVTTAEPPRNTTRPTISGTAQVGQTLTAVAGAWSGTQPISFAFHWLRCNQAGDECGGIDGATAPTYTVQAADGGHRIRVRVTATNTAGTATRDSAATAVVPGVGPPGQVRLPGGAISIPVASVALPQRLIVSGVQFTPNPVRSRNQTITARFRVTDTRGFVVRDALVFVRSTPLVTSTPAERATGADGWVSFQLRPQAGFPLGGANVQFFVRARKPGENLLAGVSTRRLVQVRTAR